MSVPVIIRGAGAVSSAGWSGDALARAVAAGTPLPAEDMVRDDAGMRVVSHVRRVPASAPAGPKSARLRRASSISKYAAAAAAEALGPERIARVADGSLRVGVVCTLMNGCVNYTNRFFGEVLADPSVASPILFPETVFNAPSSHLSATFGSTAPNDTLIGDGAEYITGLEVAAEWIVRGEVDGCLVIGCEEADWLCSEAAAFYSKKYVTSEGAGALYLEGGGEGVALLQIPDPVPLAAGMPRSNAMTKLRESLEIPSSGRGMLVDGRTGIACYDRAEEAAWRDWAGARCSPREILGEGMGASAAWQAVFAWHAVCGGMADYAIISAIGGSKEAAGAVIGRI